MRNTFLLSLVAVMGAGLASAAPSLTTVSSAAPAPSGDTPSLEVIASRIKGAKASELRPTPIKGIYEYQRGAEIAYVSEDGKYAFAGDMYALGSSYNLTEARRREVRRNLISGVPEASMVAFSPKEYKYTITVFTDVDCAYCRKLHSQIADYNKLGIRVRYVSFPRTGPDTESWTRAEQVWCAKDRNAALTVAKLGKDPGGAVCATNPVASQYQLGRSLQISGTPSIVTEFGDMIEGYAPPMEMLKELQTEASRSAPTVIAN
jgi:thiol:disulfide interchange protein DsbC